MVPQEFHDFCATSAAVSGALIGLLFGRGASVQMQSIARDRGVLDALWQWAEDRREAPGGAGGRSDEEA